MFQRVLNTLLLLMNKCGDNNINSNTNNNRNTGNLKIFNIK